ncbi:MAG: tyrosine-protein phosphatase [Nocardioidaceae bacterium]
MTTLAWSGCRNVRDLGGLPTRDGLEVRPRRLVRSDNVAGLDEAGYRAMLAYGVGRVVDLRGGIPSEPEPSTSTENADRLVVSVPWIDPERDPERDAEAETALADVYRGSLDRNVRRVAAVVRAFLDAPAGPVVLHCSAGKDRTGMAVSLLLETADVPREHVVVDYALSEEALGIPTVLADHPGPPEARAYAEEHWRTRPATMAAALGHLDSSYGGVVGYLRGPCGLTGDEVGAVRDRLTRP